MLKNGEYLKTVKRPYAPFFASLIFHGISNSEHYRAFIREEYAVKDVIKSEGVWYYSKKEILLADDLAFKNWIIPEKFIRAEKEFYKREKNLLKAVNKKFSEFCHAYEAYMPALILVWRADEPVAREAKRLLEQKLSSEEAEKLLNALNIPLEDNNYKKEEFELVNCVDLKKHAEKFEWINSRYGELHPYTTKEAKAKLLKINREAFLKKYEKEKIKLKQAARRAKNILGKKEGHIIDFLQFIVYYRTQRTDVMNKAGYLYAPRLKKMAEGRGLIYEQLLHCTKDELAAELPSIGVISERIAGHAMVMENKAIRCAFGQESKKIEKFLSEKPAGVVNCIRGNIASRGLIKGKVKIISGRGDYVNFKNGDILVASMTTPNMMPIMKKAAAFVTDEGGITCHAAIISREMKKPCVIGTKIATKVLKDGDVVEVDANLGVVKLIKNKK